MKKFFFFCLPFFFIAISSSISNAKQKKEYFDKNWIPTHSKTDAKYYRTTVKVKDENGNSFYEVKDYYLNDTLQYESKWKSLKTKTRIGKSIWYYPNGKIQSLCSYDSKGRREGDFLKYFPSGVLQTKKTYVHDTLVGKTYTKYSENDSIYLISNFNSVGLQDGLNIIYTANRKKIRESNLKNGKLIGVKSYTESGMIDTVYSPTFILPDYPEGFDAFIKYVNKEEAKNDKYGDLNLMGTLIVNCKIDTAGKLNDFFPSNYEENYIARDFVKILENSKNWSPFKVVGMVEPTEIRFEFRYYLQNIVCEISVTTF
jgi:antitoxin component YwqK of YwqJK toxin-antitoxin module